MSKIDRISIWLLSMNISSYHFFSVVIITQYVSSIMTGKHPDTFHKSHDRFSKHSLYITLFSQPLWKTTKQFMIICDDIHRSVKQDVNKTLLFYCLDQVMGENISQHQQQLWKYVSFIELQKHNALLFRKDVLRWVLIVNIT